MSFQFLTGPILLSIVTYSLCISLFGDIIIIIIIIVVIIIILSPVTYLPSPLPHHLNQRRSPPLSTQVSYCNHFHIICYVSSVADFLSNLLNVFVYCVCILVVFVLPVVCQRTVVAARKLILTELDLN
jgi:hypothetical protein